MDDSYGTDQGRDVRRRFEQDPPQGLTDEDSARLDMILAGVGAATFPATREALVERARRGGDDELAVELRSLPGGSRYATVDDLLLAMGVGSAGRIDVPGVPPRRPDAGPPVDPPAGRD